ncbi:MAG: hypothetical protein F6J93_06650 [Oscillatoria sp. SIO1A7]|nr:hypothetical protein [Oscillatoria sp. SIO1A7]
MKTNHLLATATISLLSSWAALLAPGTAQVERSNFELAQGSTFPFETCVFSETWTRPTDEEQVAHLQQVSTRNARSSYYYVRSAEDLYNQEHVSKYWTADLLILSSFGVTYSLHADPLHYSGIWFGEGTENMCSKKGRSTNSPPLEKLIRIWSFAYEIKSVEWLGDRYRVKVRPMEQGIHTVRFYRHDSEPSRPGPQLKPIEIVNSESGELIKTCTSGYNTLLECSSQ